MEWTNKCTLLCPAVDCWQSVFLSKFQQELGENISLKENGTRHWRGTHDKPGRLSDP